MLDYFKRLKAFQIIAAIVIVGLLYGAINLYTKIQFYKSFANQTRITSVAAEKVQIDSINKNRYVKFRFLMDGEKPKENDTLEFRLEVNDLTQEVFVRVEEYTESDDLEESYQIWDNLLAQLKEIIGA